MGTGSGPKWPKGPEIVIPNLPKMPRLPGRTIGIVVLAVVVIVLLLNSYYQVEPEEEAIVLRLGRYTGETIKPGPHFKIPLIDRVFRVPVNRQRKVEFGFRTLQPGVRTRYTETDFKDESLMLTGDLNVADVEWIVQYRIVNPYNYTFKVRNVEETFRDLSEAVTRAVIGDSSVDEVLTIGRERIAAEAKVQLQALCDKFETGIKVEQFVFQDVNPPDKVKPSFNEVNESIQQKERLINEAWSEYNKAVPRAKGVAEQQIRSAEGYAIERVNNAKGDAARFLALLKEYRKAPAVTRKRLYLETIEKVFPALGDRVIVDEDLRNVLPLLNLDKGTTATLPAPKGGK
ncbi:MAG: FtsH protease activity modulator HflK [Acidobacteriota bacterium]